MKMITVVGCFDHPNYCDLEFTPTNAGKEAGPPILSTVSC